ncbi:hypothetical protein [Lysobacter sp. Root667]|uniref:hypothetical protein n=1 Tax=Lysobacter sp. Root667 TaxID=1736581 RepID=UPI0012DE2D8A|nr:hypothetical protein [Lysobacter sp. Root667]
MKDWLKILGFLLLAIAIFYGLHAMDERRRQRLEAKCALSESCLNERAASQSMATSSPVTSSSGKRYFHGIKCSANCDEIAQGYSWADRVGLTNEEGCDELNDDRRDGCLAYYEELLESQRDPGDSYDPE